MTTNKSKMGAMFGERSKQVFTSPQVLTGYANVYRIGTSLSGAPQYSLNVAFDPSTAEGKEFIEQLTTVHTELCAHELEQLERGGRKGYSKSELPLAEVDPDALTENGRKVNPDVFTKGMLKLKLTSTYQPSVFTSRDGKIVDISEELTHEIPIGSKVRIRINAISYNNAAAKTVGMSLKLGAIKVISLGDSNYTPFDGLEEEEGLTMESSTSATDLDESIGI